MGYNVYEIGPDEDRPQLDTTRFRQRSIWDNVGFFNSGFELRQAGIAILNTLRTTLLPVVLWATAANAAFLASTTAGSQLLSFALLTQGWRFELMGLALLPSAFASLLVYIFAGPVADRISLFVTRRRNGREGNGGNNSNTRQAEDTLPNFVLPFVLGIAGIFLFGAAAQQRMHPAVLLLAAFMVTFGYLTVLPLNNVLAVESYPMWAGPVLINVSSIRIIIAFFLASKALVWAQEKGAMATFSIYGVALLVISLGIPTLFFFGERLRAWTAGRVGRSQPVAAAARQEEL